VSAHVATKFRVRWEDANGFERQVTAAANIPDRTVSLALPSGDVVTVDVVTARAVGMLVSHVVYGPLEPEGPYLSVEYRTARAWADLR
jgi:hypothetical protein